MAAWVQRALRARPQWPVLLGLLLGILLDRSRSPALLNQPCPTSTATLTTRLPPLTINAAELDDYEPRIHLAGKPRSARKVINSLNRHPLIRMSF